MAQRVYATLADYEDFTDGEHSEESEEVINAKLRRASIMVDGLTRNSRYRVDDDGYPIDPDISDAFRDATCAQLAYWDETEDITGAVSQEGTVTIGSVSLGARGRTAGNGAPDEQQARIAPEAIDILRNAGLITGITAHR